MGLNVSNVASFEDEARWVSLEALGTHDVFAEEFLRRYVAEAAAWPFEGTIQK